MKKLKFNIIDFLIIVAVFACVIGVALRYDLVNKIGLNSSKDEVEISFMIIGVRIGSTEAMVEGDTFYWVQNDMEIGTLLSKEVTSMERFIFSREENMYKKVLDDKRYTIRGVISAAGNMTDSGFMLNGTQFLAPGKDMEVRSRNIKVTLTITDIKQVSG